MLHASSDGLGLVGLTVRRLLFVRKLVMSLSVVCPLDRIWNHRGDKLLGCRGQLSKLG